MFGLSIRTEERDLDEEFSRFGTVEKVTIVYDQRVSLLSSYYGRMSERFVSLTAPVVLDSLR